MNIAFGLDFGTTNSVLSVCCGNEIEVIDLDVKSLSPKTLKSVIFFDEEGDYLVGQKAIEQYVEYGGSYGRFMQSIKAFLPSKSFKETYVFGRKYTIEDLVALILKEIKHRGELYVGRVVDTVFLGRPVLFSDKKDEDLLAEERLREAAFKAGFVDINFVYEPIAATLAYEITLPKDEEKLVLMGDFGGGTSDFVVMKLKGGQTNFLEVRDKDILATGGVYIGGDTFDGLIMWEKMTKHFGKDVTFLSTTKNRMEMPLAITRMLCRWHEVYQLRDRKTLEGIRSIRASADDKKALDNLETLILENLSYMLFRSIEKAKCELSDTDITNVVFKEKGISITEEMTRSEFEDISSETMSKLDKCVDEVLQKSGVKAEDIDVVLLTGGTSFIPFIRANFADRFGKDKIKQVGAFTSVAYGLGVSSIV